MVARNDGVCYKKRREKSEGKTPLREKKREINQDIPP